MYNPSPRAPQREGRVMVLDQPELHVLLCNPG